MPLIKCTDLSLGYERTPVLENVSFEVEEGQLICIVGENGSGKSTLMKGLLRLLPPLSGTVTFSDPLKRTEIGYMPQKTEIQSDFPISVFEAVLSGRLNKLGLRPFYGKKDKEKAADALRMMDIGSLAEKSFHDLSGGQQQRVLLARAFCAADKLLLLDEPASELDPMVSREFYSTVKKINVERKMTVIMITHDMAAAKSIASHILHLGSRQLFFGTSEDYFGSDFGKNFAGYLNYDR